MLGSKHDTEAELVSRLRNRMRKLAHSHASPRLHIQSKYYIATLIHT